MASYQNGRNGRRSRGGSRRRGDQRSRRQDAPMRAPAKKSLLQRIMDLFTGGGSKPAARPVPQRGERPVRALQRRRRGPERRGRHLSSQSAFEGICLRPDEHGGRSEARRGGIARQGIPRSQVGRERRKIERTPFGEL